MSTLGVIGNISRDLAVYPGGRRYEMLGGAALHVARSAARAGLAAAPVSVIGADLSWIKDDPRLAGIDLSYVTVAPGASCAFRLTYADTGELATTGCSVGAARTLTRHAIQAVGSHGVYHVCCRRPLDVGAVLSRIAARGVAFSADFHLASATELMAAAAPDRFGVFLHRNADSLRTAADMAVAALLRASSSQAPNHERPVRSAGTGGQCTAFIEPSPYSASNSLDGAARVLRSQGWLVHAASRLGEHGDPLALAVADWAAIQGADLAVIDTSGPETPSGAAFIVGACTARGTQVLAANWRGCWTYARGREPNWRNLMIQYAASGHFASLSEFAAMITPAR